MVSVANRPAPAASRRRAQKANRRGSPQREGMRATVETRFRASYKVNPVTGCWEWQRLTNQDGYPRFFYAGHLGYGHRYIWETEHDSIPDYLEVDHLCRVRSCVNPAHLELVTHLQNVLRGWASRTHCRSGHPRTGPGSCKLCRRAADHRFRLSHPAYRQRYAN